MSILEALDGLANLTPPPQWGLEEARAGEMLNQWSLADRSSREVIRGSIDRTRSGMLVGLAEKAASEIVRRHDRDLLVTGLVALSLFSPDEIDARDAMVVYPLHLRACEILGLDLEAVTNEAARLTDEIGEEFLMALIPNSPETSGMYLRSVPLLTRRSERAQPSSSSPCPRRTQRGSRPSSKTSGAPLTSSCRVPGDRRGTGPPDSCWAG